MFALTVTAHPQLLACSLGMLAGVSAHLGLFIHGEWHVQAPHIVRFHFALLVIVFGGAIYYNDSPLGKLFTAFATATFSYIVAVFWSIVLYRIVPGIHRLSDFPGPLILRTSKLWHVWACRHSRNHFFLESLFQRYGEFVRTGPSEITVFHPDVYLATDGPDTECIKSEWYDLLHPDRALLTTRDRIIHDARRRDWKQGFINRGTSVKSETFSDSPEVLIVLSSVWKMNTNGASLSPPALASHAAKSIKHAEILDAAIEANAFRSQPSTMRDLFYWYGFDLMGDFVMNKPFGMLASQKWHYLVTRLQHALSLLGPASPAPWLIQLAFHLGPKIYQVQSWNLVAQWSWDEIHSRLQAGYEKQPSPDLIHYLLEQTNRTGDLESLYTMRGDTLQAIVAGRYDEILLP